MDVSTYDSKIFKHLMKLPTYSVLPSQSQALLLNLPMSIFNTTHKLEGYNDEQQLVFNGYYFFL